MVQPWNLGTTFDFSPLGNIGKNFIDGYDRGRRMTAMDRLGGELTSANPDYRKAAAYALDAGESGSAIGLLGLAQKDRQAQLGRLADAEAGSALAALTGGGGAARPRLLSDLGTNGAGVAPPSVAPGPPPGAEADPSALPDGLGRKISWFRPANGANNAAAYTPEGSFSRFTDLHKGMTQLASVASAQGAAAANGGPQANAQPGGDVYDDPNVPDQGAGVPLAYKAGPGVAPSRIDQDDTAALPNSSGAPNSTSAPASTPRTFGGPNFVPPNFDGWASKQNIGTLSSLMAKPYLSASMKEVVKMHLAAALNNAEKVPEDIKAFMWARSNGETTAKTYQEWKALGREEKDPGAKVKAEAAARREEANRLGLREGSPERIRYIAEGKIGADEKPDHKAIGEADAAITSAQEALNSIREAKSLSAKAYDGAFADLRGAVAANFGSEGGFATLNLNNVVQTGALAQLKSIFGGNPTEGERKILLEVSGSAEQPRAVRDAIFARAEKAIERRLGIAMNKAAELRDRSYYKPGGGQSGRAATPQANAGSAAPKAAPGARYDELVDQGLTKQQAYQRMHEEGY